MVQTKIASVVTNKLNKNYNTEISIDRVDLSSLRRVKLKRILIKDHHGDTLIFVDKLSTSILNYKNISKNNIALGHIKMSDGFLHLKTYKDETVNNLTTFIQKFETDTVKSGNPFQLTSSKVELEHVDFDLFNLNKKENQIVYYHNITGLVNDFSIYRSDVSGDISNLSFIDDHQIDVKRFDTQFAYANDHMDFKSTVFETDRSYIEADIGFKYEIGDLSNFTSKVLIDANFKKSDIALSDLKKFYGEFGTNDVIHFSGHTTGTLRDFKVNKVLMRSDRSSMFKGNLRFKEVLNKKKFYMHANIDQLVSNYDHLKNLLPNLLGNKIPTAVEEIGNFYSKGKVTLTNDDIIADLDIRSDIGNAKTDLQIFNLNDIDRAEYKGQIELDDIDMAKLTNDTLFGKFSLIGGVEGQGFDVEHVNTKVDGLILKHQYKGYTYENIEVSGVFKEKHFDGYLGINEPNIELEFRGLADLSDEKLFKFDFNADVEYVDFFALNLYKKDSTAIAKGIIDMNIIGSNLDDVIGQLHFKKSTYINEKDIYYFKDFEIASTINNDVRRVTINSPEIISGSMEGKFKFDQIAKISKNSLGSLFVNYQKEKVSPGQYVNFDFKIYNKIIDAILPMVSIGSNTFIKGEMVSDEDKFEVTLKSPEISVYGNDLEDIRLQVDNKNEIYNTLLSIDYVNTDFYDIADLNLVNVTLNDTLFIKTTFEGGEDRTEQFDFSFFHTINEKNQSVFGIKHSNFTIKDNEWEVNPTNNKQNKIVFEQDLSTVAIDNINFKSGYQFIDLAGLLNGKDDKYLDLRLENVNLNAITPDIDSVALNGKVNGNLSMKTIDNRFLPVADVRINYFNINNDYYGDLTLNATADQDEDTYTFDALISNADLKTFEATGKVDFRHPEAQIDAEVLFEKFKIKAFSPLGKGVISNIRGLASGKATFTGPLSHPSINGLIDLHNSGIKVPYLNVDYDFLGDNTVLLKDNVFDFQTIEIEDVDEHTRGVLSGTISHNRFSEWFLDLDLSTDELLVLNTEETDESLYYGTGFLSGNASFKGPTDNLVIDVQGKTLAGTEFIIPISYVSNVNTSRLIHFEDPNAILEEEEESGEVIFENLRGLTINFDLDVTKDAIAQVVIDKVTGSLLRGSGDGKIRMNMDTNGKFEMYGNLLIDNGEYQFKNLINKDFKVNRGGTIVWNGNPYDAVLSLEAVNHTKANPSVLLTEISSSRKIDVELITYITGSLSNAEFNFDIRIPNASSMVSSELDFKLSKEDDKLTQFFSVLATGTFMNLDQKNNAGFNGNAAITGTLAEKASSFLSQILQSDSDNLQVGVSYDAGVSNSVENVITDDQLGISVSGRIADKVIVSGKVGVPVGANANSKVIGEVEVAVPLNEAETLMGKVYNRQNEIQFDIVDGEGYTQGAGISYRFEFDNSKEFLNKVGLKKTKEEKELAKKKRDSVRAHKKSVKQKKKDSSQ